MTDKKMLLSTGIAGLDAVLDGGLSHPSLGVIIGAPGAGKTILASHILFNAARRGQKTIVFTSYSEGMEQYVSHLQSLDFFDASLLGSTVQLFTLAGLMTTDDTTPDTAIARTIRASGAKVVLLDGFQSADVHMPAGQAIRTILSALATQIRYLDTTVLVTIAGNTHDSIFHTEMTIADVAIGLEYSVRDRRHQRLLEIVKLRGRAQQPGLHSYQIDSTGVQVFPRIESTPPLAPRAPTHERMPFQLPELDNILHGGPNAATTTMLAGAPGVGKTTLGMYWALAQAEPSATSVFVSFAEHPEQLVRKAAAFGLDLQGAIDNGSIRIVRFVPADINPDYVAWVLLRELAAPEVRRLVIDDISVLLHELGDRTRDYLSALNELVYSAHVTGMYLLEITAFEGLRVNLTNSPLAVLGDNVIVMQQYEIGGYLRHVLAVLRMRLSFFDHTIRELVLSEKGIRIATLDESTRKQLAISEKEHGKPAS